MTPFDLSIIVPIRNERPTVPVLLDMLARQTGVHFEVILVDGGSEDGSLDVVAERQEFLAFPLVVLESVAGRARQLNRGASRASADLLLFLHVDSIFPATDALHRAVECYRNALHSESGAWLGGHFQLEFLRQSAPYSFGYYFWEWKARLDRPDCTHGDQGLLLSRELFRQVGPFDEAAVIAEETLLAEKLRCSGRWLLLPSVIQTSARRFETEGLQARQTLNALLMNFAAIDWTEFFSRATDVYRSQNNTEKLLLKPYLDLVAAMIAAELPEQRRQIWLGTGAYVRTHAWQIPFSLDARRAYLRRVPVGEGKTPLLDFHDRWFDRLTDNRFGRLVATGLTWCWFQWVKWCAARLRP